MSASDLAPGILIAVPQMDDPNFSRSVVLLRRPGAGTWPARAEDERADVLLRAGDQPMEAYPPKPEAR